MKKYDTTSIRNVAMVGGKGVGKTSFIDCVLYATKVNTRIGRVDDRSSMVDYDPIEQERKQSISSKVIPVEWESIKINFLDTPGYGDFIGEAVAALRVADVAVVSVQASSGVDVSTKKLFNFAKDHNIPRVFYINKSDSEHSDLDRAFKSIKDQLESGAALFQLPIGNGTGFKGVVDLLDNKAYYDEGGKLLVKDVPAEMADEVSLARAELIEAVAESSEELLEKFLENGDLTESEIKIGMVKGIASGSLSPVFIGSSFNVGSTGAFLNVISKHFPSPADMPPQKVIDKSKSEITVEAKPDKPLSSLVFKITSDPGIGDISFFRIFSGKVAAGGDVYNSSKSDTERIGHLFVLRGKERIEVDSAVAGDIVAVAKLKNTSVNDTFSEKSVQYILSKVDFPKPVVPLAVIPKTKKDQDKLGLGLQKLMSLDPTFQMHIDKEFAETIVTAMGEVQIDVMVRRLKDRFGVEVDLGKPHIPFREMITKRVEIQGKYKKQTGGHGQYGDCWLKLEPIENSDDLVFVDAIVGGSIPGKYVPAVEKGVREAMKHGTLAGYPVVNLKVSVFDGSYHTVDSSDLAFQVAASMAFKSGMEQAQPQLLEPIVNLDVYAPQDHMGDISSDISQRRGRVAGMDAGVLHAKVPMAELYQYSASLKSMTSGAGTYSMSFSHYEIVPSHVAQRIIDDTKKEKELKAVK